MTEPSPPASSAPKKKKRKPGPPDHEFFVFVQEETLMSLRLPDKFVGVFAEHDPGYVFLRETSTGQETWRATTFRDGAGRMFLEGDWAKFAGCYKLEEGFFLTFRFRQDKNGLLIKVFDGQMCRRFYHPVKE